MFGNLFRRKHHSFVQAFNDADEPPESRSFMRKHTLVPDILDNDAYSDVSEDDVAPSRFVIMPYSRPKLFYDWLGVLIIIYVMVEVPIRCCFFAESDSLPEDGFNYFVDVYFLVDVVVNFFTAFHDRDGVLVTRPRSIARAYLRSWFFIDFLTAIPLSEFLALISDSGGVQLSRFSRLLRIFRITRLFKLLRLFQIVRVLKKHEQQSIALKNLLRIGRLAFFLVFIAHLIGCLWFFMSYLDDFGPDTWVYVNNMVNQPFSDQYVVSVYWAITTLATVGYGDIHPYNSRERIFAMTCMIIGAVVFAYIVGNVSQLVQFEDDPTQMARERMESISAYMRHKKLPKELQRRIRDHFEYVWRKKTVLEEEKILLELPNHLRTEVATLMHDDIIENIPFFKNLDQSIVAAITLKLKPLQCGPGVVLFRANDHGREMYIIIKGELEVWSEKRFLLHLLSSGSYVGEEAVFFEDNSRRDVTVRTASYCEILCLSRKDLLDVLIDYPDLFFQMVELANSAKPGVKKKQARKKPVDKVDKKERKPSRPSVQDLVRSAVKTFKTRASNGSIEMASRRASVAVSEDEEVLSDPDCTSDGHVTSGANSTKTSLLIDDPRNNLQRSDTSNRIIPSSNSRTLLRIEVGRKGGDGPHQQQQQPSDTLTAKLLEPSTGASTNHLSGGRPPIPPSAPSLPVAVETVPEADNDSAKSPTSPSETTPENRMSKKILSKLGITMEQGPEPSKNHFLVPNFPAERRHSAPNLFGMMNNGFPSSQISLMQRYGSSAVAEMDARMTTMETTISKLSTQLDDTSSQLKSRLDQLVRMVSAKLEKSESFPTVRPTVVIHQPLETPPPTPIPDTPTFNTGPLAETGPSLVHRTTH
eukprot:GILJ01005198.1.p1 GENE.GILJ01005198.1~~GILJ01005198.1.p1  ORF type:complete len:869 (+),score=110.14 GILJ01005198.1:173-2779(+)